MSISVKHIHFPHLSPLTYMAITIVLVLSAVAGWEFMLLGQQDQRLAALQQQQSAQSEQDQSYLAQLQAQASKAEQLEAEFNKVKSDEEHQKYAAIDALYAQFQDIVQKVSRNANLKLDTSSVSGQYSAWGTQLLQKQYDPLKQSLSAAQSQLDKQYQLYQASLVKPTAQPQTVAKSSGGSTPSGYSVPTIATSRGSFKVYLVKMPLASVTVKTVTANTGNCTNQCPTKSLSQYVGDSGAYAGINGTYFCPPDYSWCSGKTNSYDFAVYNSFVGNWLNSNALSWNSEGLATFNGHSAKFYRYASDFAGGPVTAGIANFPPLLVHGGQVAITDADLDTAQKTKGLRGALGVDSANVYLAVVSSASILDAAYTMQALGATEVLNLDGGGSSALYIAGSYKVGPGRSLPNAVVLVQ